MMFLKKCLSVIFSFAICFPLFAQSSDFEGTWKGAIGVNGVPLHLVLHLQKNVDGTYRASMDSPDQGAKGIPVSEVTVSSNSIKVIVKQVRGSFQGVLAPHGQSMEGQWRQGGATYPLIFDRFPLEAELLPANELSQEMIGKLLGDWKGTLRTSAGTDLLLILHFKGDSNDNFSGALDSPYQGALGMPVTRIVAKDSELDLQLTTIQSSFQGKISADGKSIRGLWIQGGRQLPLRFVQVQGEDVLRRPQMPKEPFPYQSIDIKFKNQKAGINLAGTLSYPEGDGPFNALVLVTGSGPQDRDETIFGHKPFLVLADHLTRAGYAVLRYDDRGNGKSGGDMQAATTEDFAEDAAAAIHYLKQTEKFKTNKIGILGHSEGAIIAAMLAAEKDGPDFIVMLGGPVIRGDSLLLLQNKYLLSARGLEGTALESVLKLSAKTFRIASMPVKAEAAARQIESYAGAYWDAMDEETEKELGRFGVVRGFMKKQTQILLSPWFRYFLRYDPLPALQKIAVPVLLLYGEKDLQVPAIENVAKFKKIQKNGHLTLATMKVIPGANHLFQPAESGLVTEYAKIETTMDEKVLNTISEWLNALN